MSTARARIFAAIRRRLGPRETDPEKIAAEAASLVSERAAIQPDLGGASLIEHFIAKATSERVTASVERLRDIAELPGAVRRYIEKNGLEAQAAVQPVARLDALDWSGITRSASAAPDQTLAVTLAEYGIAETGSVVCRSGPDAPVLMNFLPLHHLVVLDAARILAHIEDLWPHLGGADAPQSRLLSLITGTSGTADIEAINIRGAHGPRYMHILLLG